MYSHEQITTFDIFNQIPFEGVMCFTLLKVILVTVVLRVFNKTF